MNRMKPIATRRTQQGITLVLISLIMLILIGMGAFAVDLSHQVLNKARLQNAVDSAALASALVADQTSDVGLAKKAAIDALNSFVTPDDELPDGVVFGNKELAVTQEKNISVTFSKDKQTFVNADMFSFDKGDDSDIYVRVAVSDVSLTQYLSHVFGVGKNVSASAVAGPSAPITTTCNVSPVGMCGTPAKAEQAWGYMPNGDYNAKYDYEPSTIHVLRPTSHKEGGIGPGNYHLLDFGQGASTVRELFAGKSDACMTVGQKIDTQPGLEAGPVTKGLNTRFEGGEIGTGKEKEIVKADKYLEQSNVTYENYKDVYQDPDNQDYQDNKSDNYGAKAFYYADYYSALSSCESGGGGLCNPDYYEPSGQEGRRVLRVPIVDCNGTDKTGGVKELAVLGLGCFFVTQEVEQSDSIIFGQFIDDCAVQNASTGINPSNSIGPYKIQLYKDPLSGDS